MDDKAEAEPKIALIKYDQTVYSTYCNINAAPGFRASNSTVSGI